MLGGWWLMIISASVSLLVTPWVIRLAEMLGAVQLPPTDMLSEMKIEASDSNLRYKILALRNNLIKPPTAKLGGLAYTIAFVLVLAGIFLFDLNSVFHITPTEYWLWLFIILFLLVAGALQDIYGSTSILQLISILIAAFVFALLSFDLSGINVGNTYISLDMFHIKALDGMVSLVIPGDLFVILWVVLIFYAIKMQGGTDGLAEGNTVIALLFIAFVSLKFNHVQAAVLSFIWAGALLGFLVYNFYPAYIFSGSSGKLVLGFVVASLAVISGAKLGTALIVFSIPLIDMSHVIWQRLKKYQLYKRGIRGFVEVFAISDRLHLHHRLLKLGYSESTIAILEYSTTAIIGLITLFLDKRAKVVFLIVTWSLIFIAIKYINYLADRRNDRALRN